MTGQTAPGIYAGLEYTLSKEGGEWPEDLDPMFKHGSPFPLTWETFHMEFPDPKPVQGFNVLIRYYEKEITEEQPVDADGKPDGDPVYNVNITYPPWTIISQECLRAEAKFYFNYETGDNLVASAPGDYGSSFAGINDTIGNVPIAPPAPIIPGGNNIRPDRIPNEYSYTRIFDQSNCSWIPRLSPGSQRPLNSGLAQLPSSPFSPESNPPVYPVDAILAFVPDPREIVNITFRVTTEYQVAGAIYTDEVIITHPISQGSIDTGDKLRALMEKSYFGNDLEHPGLYPPQQEELYTQAGRLKRGKQLNEPFAMKQLTRKTYPYDKDRDDWVDMPERDPR